MAKTSSKVVEVRGVTGDTAWSNLAEIIAGLLPVKFDSSNVSSPATARLVIGEDSRPDDGIPVLRIPKSTVGDGGSAAQTVKLQFSGEMPFPFRGRTIQTVVAVRPVALRPVAGETVLASIDSAPVWVMSERNGQRSYRSAFALPDLPVEKLFREGFHGGRFMELLPVLYWLRGLVGADRFEAVPLRACFIMDDPNLHSPRYGFVDFRTIVRHATRENYHVSFATIPLDGWFASQAAVSVFARNTERISLMVHGNNHTYKELGQNYAPEKRVGLLRQAIRRIERLERKTGLSVSRVMAPPHGACSDEMLELLPACGFDAATISHGSLRSFNPGKPWTSQVGYLPSELIRGCPVMPRWGLNGNTEATILLAAYLGQPLLLMGHHDDLKDGVEWLDEAARLVNGLGDVSWSDIGSVGRKNYQWRIEGETMHVRASGRRLLVRIPNGVRRISVDRALEQSAGWRLSVPQGVTREFSLHESVEMPAGFSGEVILEESGVMTVDSQGVAPSAMWPFMRRLLTEGRDRLRSSVLAQRKRQSTAAGCPAS